MEEGWMRGFLRNGKNCRKEVAEEADGGRW